MLIDLVIDLGSESIKIYKRGGGLILNEPSAALVDKRARSVTLRETGSRAVRLAADMQGGAVLVRPIKNAAVVDEEIAVLLLKNFFYQLNIRPSFADKMRTVVLTGCGLAYGDRKNIENVMKKAGAPRTYIIDGLFALYAYTGVEKGFFVDIGGAVSNVGFVCPSGIIAGCQADIAGNAVNEEICKTLLSRHAMYIGGRTAEKVKLAAAGQKNRRDLRVSVSGRDSSSGEYRAVKILAGEVAECVRTVLDKLILLINSLLSSLPADEYNFVCKNGIFLSGGTARINGLPEYLAEKLRLKIMVIKEYEDAAIIGGAKFFEEKGLLKNFI
ncbi:MAG: rod shape-determining protein [Clostridiales bacterium]|jgi:rod shape-determining protein MreB|nr:rod shape-determining protein [Clostridiales bacterium]